MNKPQEARATPFWVLRVTRIEDLPATIVTVLVTAFYASFALLLALAALDALFGWHLADGIRGLLDSVIPDSDYPSDPGDCDPAVQVCATGD